jgi:hypothetical protein
MGKKLFAADRKTYEFIVLSYFLESSPLLNDDFPYFEVIKWI